MGPWPLGSSAPSACALGRASLGSSPRRLGPCRRTLALSEISPPQKKKARPNASPFSSHIANTSAIQHLAIDHESSVLSHLVVELHCGRIGLVCVPVDSSALGSTRDSINFLNQRPSHTLSPCRFHRKQILQIA